MTNEQLRQLSKMKKLINAGHRRFVIRKDRDYVEDLLSIGITEDLAWKEIISLTVGDYCTDYRPFYAKGDTDALIFKKYVNDNLVYIKLKIEKNNYGEMTVCLSFHVDYS